MGSLDSAAVPQTSAAEWSNDRAARCKILLGAMQLLAYFQQSRRRASCGILSPYRRHAICEGPFGWLTNVRFKVSELIFPKEERRKRSRVRVPKESGVFCQLELPDDERFPVGPHLAVDVSDAGIGIGVAAAVTSPPIGSRVTLTISYRGGRLRLTGIVRHVTARPPGRVIGVEFERDEAYEGESLALARLIGFCVRKNVETGLPTVLGGWFPSNIASRALRLLLASPRAILWTGGLALGTAAVLIVTTMVREAIAHSQRAPIIVKLTEPPPLPKPPRRSLAEYAVITDRDIFNLPKPPELPPPVQIVPLNATLLGTALGFEGGEAYAIFEDGKDHQQQLYRVADRFQERTVLRIAWDRVTLKHGDDEEVLKVPLPSDDLPRRSGAGEKNPQTSFILKPLPDPGGGSGDSGSVWPVQAAAAFEGGKPLGVRVTGVRHGSIFEKTGLKSGDIVKRVNDSALADPLAALGSFKKLEGATKVSLEIVRDGKPLTLPLPEQANTDASDLHLASEIGGNLTATERTALWSAVQDPAPVRRYLERKRQWPPLWEQEVKIHVMDIDRDDAQG